MVTEVILAAFVALTTPDGRDLEVNPDSITSMQAPMQKESFAPGVHCVLFTNDHRFLSVAETCEWIRILIEAEHQ
jgi:hypothetical protein